MRRIHSLTDKLTSFAPYLKIELIHKSHYIKQAIDACEYNWYDWFDWFYEKSNGRSSALSLLLSQRNAQFENCAALTTARIWSGLVSQWWIEESLQPCRSESMSKENRLIDTFGRKHQYLRISVTDKCNLRCTYCMPYDGIAWKKKNETVDLRGNNRASRNFRWYGRRQNSANWRRAHAPPELIELVKRLATIDGLKTLAMTTNATLLAIMLKLCVMLVWQHWTSAWIVSKR